MKIIPPHDTLHEKGGVILGKFSELKRYKFFLSFKGGHDLILETNTDIRKANREHINGGTFVVTENHYTINIAQLESIKVKIQK